MIPSHVRHDLRHPIAAMYLVGSTAHELGGEISREMLVQCGAEMLQELERFRELVTRYGVSLDESELARAVAAFERDPSDPARGLAVQDACRGVLAQLGLAPDGGPEDVPGAGPGGRRRSEHGGDPTDSDGDGFNALED